MWNLKNKDQNFVKFLKKSDKNFFLISSFFEIYKIKKKKIRSNCFYNFFFNSLPFLEFCRIYIFNLVNFLISSNSFKILSNFFSISSRYFHNFANLLKKFQQIF